MQWLKNVARGGIVSSQVHQKETNVLKECRVMCGMWISVVSFTYSVILSTPLRMDSYLLLTILSAMKMSFKKHSPKKRHYRDCKCFDQTKFENNLNEKWSEIISNYESFGTTFIEVLNKHAPSRKRNSIELIMLHTLQKPWGKRICIGLKTKTQTNLKPYKKHKNFCSKLYKRERRRY